jgi:glycine oxidase
MEEVGFDERATVSGVRELLAATCALMPGAAQAYFRAVRVGLRPATADNLPAIGPSRVSPRIVYATGHFRNGILLAPLTAAVIADVILEGKRDAALDVLNPGRFGDC